MTENEIQKALDFARFNQSCEGFEVTGDNEKTGREMLGGKITANTAVANIIKKHTKWIVK